MKAKQQVPPKDAQLEQLIQIRKLLVLLLLKSGATSNEIARALKIGSSTLRKEMPTRVGRFSVEDGKQAEILEKIEQNTRRKK
jgi:DNA-binding NarL/FixJ family response regulator